MFYAYEKGGSLVVGAAETMSDFTGFFKLISSCDMDFTCTQPDFDEMISDYKGFKDAPYVLSFKDASTKDAFMAKMDIKLFSPNIVLYKHQDITGSANEGFDDTRSLGDIYGLNDFDPWDKRTEEEKQKDLKNKKKAEESKKSGNLTGDSFAAPNDETLSVEAIRTSRDENGNIQIDDILGNKGFYAERKEQEVKHCVYKVEFSDVENLNNHLGIDIGNMLCGNTIETEDACLAHRLAFYYGHTQKISLFEDGVLIDPSEEAALSVRNSKGKICYKLSVKKNRLENILPNIDAEILSKCIDRGEIVEDCWLIFAQQQIAKIAETKLADFDSEVFPVNNDGMRLVPKGVEMFKEKPFVEPPRVWNDMADQLAGMSDEQLAENHKKLSGKEFLFAGSYVDTKNGCIIHIVPRSYFEKNDEAWHDYLHIEDILPRDVKEISPGVFQSRSRGWLNLYNEMQRRGFAESMAFKLYVNLIS